MVQQTADRTADGGAARASRRRPVFYLGLVLVTVGLGLLGYVGWQLWGTTWVSERRQEALVQDLTQAWESEPGTRVDRAAAEQGTTPLGEADAIVRIPAFGDDYAVPVLQGTTSDVLSSGFGHFEDSVGPGQVGNYALAGHRITHGEPLRRLPELRPGDEVVVETRTAIYTYELTTDPDDLVVSFEDTWVVDPLPTNPDGGVQPDQAEGQRLITLTTCAELFATDERMIAFGHLVDEQAKPTG